LNVNAGTSIRYEKIFSIGEDCEKDLTREEFDIIKKRKRIESELLDEEALK